MRPSRGLLLAAFPFLLSCGSDEPPTAAESDDAAYARLDGADAGGFGIDVMLSGGEEVPPRETDGSGTLVATINQGLGQFCYELSVENLTTNVVAAHIHFAPREVAGGIVIPLDAPVGATSGSTSGCATADRALLKDIRQNPDQYYVNVHTTMFPPGEVRAQLDN